MLGKVVIRSVRNAPKFAPAEREEEFEVGGRFRVEAEFFGIVVAQTEVFGFDADRVQPVAAERTPVIEPLKIRAGLAEEFEFHLLDLAHAENEVSGRDFVAERLADLTDSERNLFTRGTLDVNKVRKDTLRGFGTKINGVFRVLGYAQKGFEHKVELTNIRKVMLFAGRAGYIVFFDKRFHFGLSESVDGL